MPVAHWTIPVYVPAGAVCSLTYTYNLTSKNASSTEDRVTDFSIPTLAFDLEQ